MLFHFTDEAKLVEMRLLFVSVSPLPIVGFVPTQVHLHPGIMHPMLNCTGLITCWLVVCMLFYKLVFNACTKEGVKVLMLQVQLDEKHSSYYEQEETTTWHLFCLKVASENTQVYEPVRQNFKP